MSQNNGNNSPLVQTGVQPQKAAEELKEPSNEELISKFIDGDGKSGADKAPEKEEPKAEEESAEVIENAEENADEEVENSPDTDDSDETGADAPEEAQKPKKKKTAEERIAELTAKRREAERTAAEKDDKMAELQRQIDELKGKKPDEDLKPEKDDTKSEVTPPDPNDKKYEYGEFDTEYRKDYEAYLRKSLRAELKQEQEEARQKEEETRQAEAAAAKQQELGDKLLEHQKAGIKEYEDFEDALESLSEVETPISPDTTAMLLESDQAHKILYHLGKNPDEAREIASKSPIEQARYIGKLEAKFSANEAAPKEKPVKTTQAQTPPTRNRGSNGQFKPNDATTDFSAFKAQHAGKGF